MVAVAVALLPLDVALEYVLPEALAEEPPVALIDTDADE
jgi:hypothetical protein